MAADFEQVKQNIADTIYENGEELITGQVMQDRLLEMVSVTEEAINDVTIDPTVNVTVNNTTGTPSGSASFQNNQFSFEFSGIKGETGNSGYTGAVGELEVVNNLNSDDATAALSAYQGKVLDGKVTQLGQKVNGLVYDVTKENTGSPTFASLSALLSDANLSTLIPTSVRTGGMSIRFVQTSDNNYVQYRLMADEWSINTEDWAIADEGVYVENPEFIYVETDKEDKILWAIKTDGSIYYGAGVPQQVKDYIEERISELSLDEYEDIVAFLSDYLGSDTTLKVMIDGINAAKVDKEEGKSLIDTKYASTKSNIENPEFLEVTTDSEDKVLAGRTPDGVAFENVGFITPKVSIDGHTIESIKDREDRSEIKTDAEGKILSYRRQDGFKVEENLEVHNIIFSENAKKQVDSSIQSIVDASSAKNGNKVKKWHLPDYGTVDILSETFYLTADARYSDKNGVHIIRDYEDTDINALNDVTLDYYYIKSTLTDNGNGTYSKNANSVKLDFYAATKVTKVNNIYYVTSSLTKVEDPITGEISYEVNANSIEVTQIIDTPDVSAWPVDKKTEHHCSVTIDFGHYLSGTFNIGIKFQGSSTLHNRKRNFRFTFYKNNKFEKKDKIKIGEFVRLSGFNLKANWTDSTRIKELLLNRLFMNIWEERDTYDRYPWNKEFTPYTGATGMIKGFPISVYIGGEFYGLDIFGLKKDGKLCMLSDTDGEEDATGLLVCGVGGVWSDEQGAFINSWQPNPEYWDEELNDDEFCTDRGHIPADSTALVNFLTFVNSDDFTKENITQRMDVIGWIDYFILMQVFIMFDNTSRNVILYSNQERTKFWPFFYDLDLAWRIVPMERTNIAIDADILEPGTSFCADMTMWDKFWPLYKDEIITRYGELRDSVLTPEFVTGIFEDVAANIPMSEIIKERNRWGQYVDVNQIYSHIEFLKKRLNWLDNNYFKI